MHADCTVQHRNTEDIIQPRSSDGSQRTVSILRNGEHAHIPKNAEHWEMLDTSQAYESMQCADECLATTLDYLLDPVSGSKRKHAHVCGTIRLHVEYGLGVGTIAVKTRVSTANHACIPIRKARRR